jgi:glycogen operon protein
MSEDDWHNPDLRLVGMLLDGRSPATGIHQKGKEATILIVANGYPDVVEFQMPDCTGACSWTLLLDTNIGGEIKTEPIPVGGKYLVTARSLVAFALSTDKSE